MTEHEHQQNQQRATKVDRGAASPSKVPAASPSGRLLGLQRTVGNRETVALLRSASAKAGDSPSEAAQGRDVLPSPPVEGVKVRRSPATNSQYEILMRKIVSSQQDNLPTHAGVLKNQLNVNVNKQGLPGKEGLANIDRPREIVADIDAASIRTDDREKKSILSTVTSLARGEQFLIQGADLKKFFDAGHLIGDQLIGGTTDSFVFRNLAPQVSEFNTPNYSALENTIRGYATKGATIRMQVNLSYPADYHLTVAQLKYRKAIPGDVTAPDTTRVDFARRIPERWQLHAKLVNSSEPSATPENIGMPNPAVLGKPYSIVVAMYTTTEQDPINVSLVYNRLTHKLLATQWAPSDAITPEEVLSYVTKTYPDLLTREDVIKLMGGESTAQVEVFKKACFDIQAALLDLAEKVSELPDAPQATSLVTDAGKRIRAKIAEATAKTTAMPEAAAALVTAKAWVEDLKEEVAEMLGQQKETLPMFGFTAFTQMYNDSMSGTWNFEQSQEQMMSDYVPSSSKEAEEIEIRSGYSEFTDVTTNTNVYDAVEFGGSRGTLRWRVFGDQCPVKDRQKLRINLGSVQPIVTVVNAERPINGGAWIISWVHGM